jgi:CBS domain-containing protein
VLRAVIWWKTGDQDRATRGAATAGQVVAGIFIAIGVFEFFRGAGLGGLWIAFIGWFLLQAAGESRMQAGLRRAMEEVHVGDLMTRECATIDAGLTLQELVDQRLLRTGQRCYIVVEDGQVAGLITPHEIKLVDREKWPEVPVRSVMRPLQELRTIRTDAPLKSAIETMGRENLNQLPVMSNGHLEGVLSRAEVLNYLQTRKELKV